MDAYVPTKLRFVCEQDGEIERHLKAKLAKCLEENPNIEIAYLARVEYDARVPSSVALCLRSTSGEPDLFVIDKVNAVFSPMFGLHEHLDVLFLNPELEKRVSSACRPFYTRGGVSSHS
jgi:SseB protein C-terminal domain